MNKTLLVTIDATVGGVANYYQGICDHLPSDKVSILTVKKDKIFYSKNYPVFRRNLISDLPIWSKWLPIFWHLWKIVKKEKIKTVLVGQILPVGAVVLCLSKILNFDYIVFTHGMDIILPQKNLRKKWIAQKILKNSKIIVANSNFTKQELLKLKTDKNRIITLYPCPNIKSPASEKIKNDLIKKHNLKNKKIILSAARLVQRKGFDMAIKSIPQVIKKIDNFVYIIAGKGEYGDELKKMARNSNHSDKIIFVGKISDEELKAFYDLCDLYIMPSRNINGDAEGFGIVYLEAGSFGKPAIGGNSGGVSEAIIDNKTGILVNPESILEISEALIRLLKDKDLSDRFGRRARERIKNEFNWNQQVKKLKRFL
ncbi:MAG: glycosyltransferase family 4 protein [Patescibacteria group bacterium]|nr:glycosyltransferase family 4 protein [Patescibacteria group bacterium]